MDEVVNRIVTNLQTQSNTESETFLEDLQTLLDYTNNTQDTIDIENLYTELSARKISFTTLTNALAAAMDSGTTTNISILASKVYLSLLLVPNSPVFTLFTPMAFLSLLRSIRRAFKNPSGTPQRGSVVRNLGKKKKGAGRGGQGKNRGKTSEFEGNDGERRGFDVRNLFILLERLEMVLSLVHLGRFPDCMKGLVQTVVEIPVMAGEICGNAGVYGKLCELCARVLSEVLKGEHGDLAVSAAEILKSLTPLILLVKSPVRSFSLGFIVNRMVGVGKISSEVKKAVVNLPKFFIHKAPEKAEGRAMAVESIVEIVKVLEFEDQVVFADYVVKMSQGKGQFRLLAVDLVPALIMSLRDPLGVDSDDDGVTNSWGLRCLKALLQRCSDATAGIRAKALSNLAQLVVSLSQNNRSIGILKELMGFVKDSTRQEGGINDLLRIRCMDEKAAVRKSALLLISKLIALLGGSLEEDLLKTVGMACSDPLVSIRKAAISALSEAFRISADGSVIKEWLHSVPRLISDNESSIQEECENLFLDLVLDRVCKDGSNSSAQNRFVPRNTSGKTKGLDTEFELLYPEGVLILLKEVCHSEVTPWVKKICTSLGKKKKLKPRIAIALQNIIRTSESLWLSQSEQIEKWTAPPGAWFLLSEVSVFLPKAVEWEFLHHHWQLLDKYKPDDNHKSRLEQDVDEGVVDIESSSIAWAGDRVFLLQTISNVSVELPPDSAADLAHDFLKRLEGFDMHSTEVNAHVKALRTLCKRKALNSNEADSLVGKWVQQLLSKASQILDTYMSKYSKANKESTFFTPPQNGTSGKGKRSATSTCRLLSKAITALYTIGSSVIVCPSADLTSITPVLQAIITCANSEPKTRKLTGVAVSVKQTAPSLYIQAWLTMGKICLADGKLAKRYIPLFVQELEQSDNAALRNNIILMMADFCVRYTALVDCYMSKITECLRDPCELVRRQTFILLSRLLQRDYVKWRGVLFLRFLLCLVDESEKIRQLADFLFGNILKVKAPLLAYNSFVEAIFVLNDCNAHTGRNPNGPRNESRLFSIRGNDATTRSRRMHIYFTLLKQMAPEHLLATFAKVCAEILAAAADGALKLEDATGQSVLQDAFQVLSCKEIRLPSIRGSSDPADVEEEGGDNGGASAAAARGRVITQAVKKGLIQNTIPIFIELKRLLESKNSPLVGSLMECLRILLKDYKNEIDDILVADKQLQKELIYDMQKYESMKAKSSAAEAFATMQRSEDYRSPGNPNITNATILKNKNSEKHHSKSRVASAVADAAAAATARSVLKEVNKGASPPLSAMNVPKLKSRIEETRTRGDRSANVLESLRRRQSFESDEEN